MGFYLFTFRDKKKDPEPIFEKKPDPDPTLGEKDRIQILSKHPYRLDPYPQPCGYNYLIRMRIRPGYGIPINHGFGSMALI